jgi:hypothetical protein
MVAPSRFEKSEQLINVTTHSPATTPEAARSMREGRTESITCTSILIQKSVQRAQLDERDENPVYLVFWSIWSVSCEPNNKANSIDQTDQIDETDRIDQESRR